MLKYITVIFERAQPHTYGRAFYREMAEISIPTTIRISPFESERLSPAVYPFDLAESSAGIPISHIFLAGELATRRRLIVDMCYKPLIDLNYMKHVFGKLTYGGLTPRSARMKGTAHLFVDFPTQI